MQRLKRYYGNYNFTFKNKEKFSIVKPNMRLIRKSLVNGDDPSEKDKNNSTSLWIGSIVNYTKKFRIYLAVGAIIQKETYNLLHSIFILNEIHIDAIRMLLIVGVDPNISTIYGRTLLDAAIDSLKKQMRIIERDYPVLIRHNNEPSFIKRRKDVIALLQNETKPRSKIIHPLGETHQQQHCCIIC